MGEDLRVIVDADADPLRRELGAAERTVRGFGGEIRSQTRGTTAFNAALGKQRETLRGLATWGGRAGLAIGGVFALAIGHAIRVGAEFESQMARVQAVTGATGREMDSLRSLAIQLGADTKFSAGEAAEAMYELASAGFSVGEMKGAISGTLSLAAASSIDLAAAAEISANALRGFGLDADQSRHVADVLAQAVNSSSVEMSDLQLTMKYIGPVARATGQDFEEMVAAVGLMGDAGIKGEQAGTTLRAGLIRLVKPTKQVKEGLKEVGLTAEEMQGPNGLRSLPELVGELREGMQGLTKAEQAHALANIFGTEALSGMLTVVDAGPAKLQKLTGEFEHSSGASAKAAKTMNDTVSGAADQLTGSLETVEIQLYENFQQPLKEALLEATDIVNTEGRHLQDALSAAMATPQFKQGDIGEKVEVLVDAITGEIRRSDLPEEVGKVMVDAFNWALPHIAEAAGHGALTAAETFASGFLKSDALGKLAIGTWLFAKLGGFAALRAAGAQAGAEVSIGMHQAIATQSSVPTPTTIIAGGPGNRSRAARGPMPSASRKAREIEPVVTPDVELPDGKKKGLEWGKHFLKGFGASMLIGGGIAGALAPADNIPDRLQNALSGATFGFIPEAGPGIGARLAASAAEAFDEHFGPNLAAAFRRRGTRDLQGVQDDIKELIQAGIQTGASEADLKPLRDRLKVADITVDLRVDIRENEDDLRSGVVQRMADIKSIVARNSREIGQAWASGSDEWRAATARNIGAAVTAIRAGMKSGVIETKTGQTEIARLLREIKLVRGEDPFEIASGFASSWRKARGINQAQIAQVKTDLAKMPKDAREAAQDAMVGMARAMESKGKLVKGSADRLNSALATRFGATSRQVEESTASAMANVARSAAEGATDTGAALANIFENLSNALAAAGSSKIPHFSLTVLSAASQYHHTREATQNGLGGTPKAEGGFFVNSSDRRDHVHAILGGREAVLTVHDQPEVQAGLAVGKALGVTRSGSLGELFSGPRRPNYFAKGGFTGSAGKLSHPKLVGPEMVGAVGQAGIDTAWEAASKYLQEHLRAVSGGDIVAVGESLQRLGYEVSEHPAFGGVHPVHTAGSDHYSGHAIDVNDDAAPRGHGSSEMASLDWLAPQLMKLPHRQVIWRNHDLDTGAPIPDHMDHLHFAMALGGFVASLAKGMAQGGWVKTGYTTYDIDGPGASGNLMKGMGYAELGTAGANGGGTGYIAQALGRSGELPMEYPLDVKIGSIGKIATLFKRDRGSGQEGDPFYSIDIHHLAWDALGLTGNNKGTAFIRPAEGDSDGISDGEQKHAEAKKVKAHREQHLKQLRKAVADAKTRPGKRGALWELVEYWAGVGLFDKDSRERMLDGVRNAAGQANPFGAIPILANLAGYLKDHVEVSGRDLGDKSLADEVERVRKQGTKVGERRRTKKLKKIAGRGLDQKRRAILEGLDGDVGRLDETIDIHGRLASSESGPDGSEYTDAETGDLVGLNEGLLGKLFGRRDLIGVIIGDLGRRIEVVTEEIKKARPPESKTHWKLAGLLENRKEARSLLGEMREGLIDTQGVTGDGGRIFDTKMAISELGAPRDGVASEDNSAWTAAKEALLLEAQRNLAISQGETRVFGEMFNELGPGIPYLGAYMQGTGGMRVGRTGYALLHRDEQVVPDPKGPAGSHLSPAAAAPAGPAQVTLVFRDRSGALVELVDARVDGKIAKVDQQLGAAGRRRAVAPGM